MKEDGRRVGEIEDPNGTIVNDISQWSNSFRALEDAIKLQEKFYFSLEDKALLKGSKL